MMALPEVLAPWPIKPYPENPPPRRPLQPTRLASWIEAQAARRGETIGPFVKAELQSVCTELARLAGFGLQPQRGSHHAWLTLDGRDALVEYDYTPGEDARTYGPPEDCYEGSSEEFALLNVYVNGAWIDACKFTEDQLAEWESELRAQWAAEADADAESRAEAIQRDRELFA